MLRQARRCQRTLLQRINSVGAKDSFRLALGVGLFGVASAILLYKAQHSTAQVSQVYMQWSLGCLVSLPILVSLVTSAILTDDPTSPRTD